MGDQPPEHLSVLKDAILMTMVADVVLVSIYDAEELPEDFRVWMDAWLARRYLPAGALIALISRPGELNAQTKPARTTCAPLRARAGWISCCGNAGCR